MATITQQRSGRLSRDPLVYGLALIGAAAAARLYTKQYPWRAGSGGNGG